MKKQNFYTARAFAKEMGVNYRTVLNWLEDNLVPGAEWKASPIGEYWEIPASALDMERPKPGPKPQRQDPGKAHGRRRELAA
jgi:hypothetical protein